jgi:hypothetical protein
MSKVRTGLQGAGRGTNETKNKAGWLKSELGRASKAASVGGLFHFKLATVQLTSAAGDYSSKQLDVFVLHDRHLFRKPWLDQAAECSSTSRREQAPRKGDGFLTQISAGDDRTESATGNGLRHTPQGCEGRIKSRPAGSCRRVFSEQLLKPQKLESCRRAGTILPPFERLYLVLEG